MEGSWKVLVIGLLGFMYGALTVAQMEPESGSEFEALRVGSSAGPPQCPKWFGRYPKSKGVSNTPPHGPLLRALQSLSGGSWGILKGSWAVLVGPLF